MSVLCQKRTFYAAVSSAVIRSPRHRAEAATLFGNRDLRGHVGMNPAIIIYCPSSFQNDGTRRIRWQHNVKGAIPRGRGVCNKVSVRPFDRVTDLRRHLRRRETKILKLNLDDGGVGRSGTKYEQGRTECAALLGQTHRGEHHFKPAATCSACC